MKKHYSPLSRIHFLLVLMVLGLVSASTLRAQNIQLFTEDFQTGGSSFTLNSSGPNSNFGSNKWIVNNVYTGALPNPNTMSEDSTFGGTIAFAPYSKYLHIYDSTSSASNCSYKPSVQSDNFAYMNTGICTMGMDSVHFSFFYLCQGSGTAYGQVYYSKNNGPWIAVGQPQYNNKYKWQYEDITSPAFNHVQNLRFGFRWVNNNSAGSPTEAFGIDDVDIVGYYDATNHPVTITVDSVSPNPVCQQNYLYVYWHMSDTLCDGTYQIELSNSVGNFPGIATWVYNIYYPQTFGVVPILLPTAATAGNCYKIRISRTSPPPLITGVASACFTISNCPNVITTLQPAVTMDTNAVCIGSAIDIPFYSTGAYSNNTYTAQLSDSSGLFPTNPTVVGSSYNSTTYDPNLGSLPGSVSGQVPNVPPGCHYYIRIVSSNPNAIGSVWGPFCIQQCDIKTNNNQDLHFCVTDCSVRPQGSDTTITIQVHTYNNTAVYGPGNRFETQLLSTMNFGQIGANGIFGSVAATGDTTLRIHIPCKDSLPIIGVPAGNYYLRIIATNSSVSENSLGSVIRLSIGAPHANAELISSYNYNTFMLADTFCVGDVSMLLFNPYNYFDNSTYKWICNGINGGNPFVSPSGANSNSLFVNLGAPGILWFRVQENSYGCLGAWSPADTIVVQGPPQVNITGPHMVCQGDTNSYTVPFAKDTYYTWTATGGAVVDTANNLIKVSYHNTGNFVLHITAVNHCGTSSANITVVVKPYPVVNAGPDTTICSLSSITLSTGTGTGYTYSWSNGTNSIGTTNSVNVHPPTTTTYTVTVTGPGGCKKNDQVVVTIQSPVTTTHTDSLCLMGGNTVTLQADTGATFSWTNGSTSRSITVSDSGTYTVMINRTNAVCPQITEFKVKSEACPVLVLPNVFTPNGGGGNDFFTPVNTANFDNFSIKIYDRWGIVVFESTDPFFKWDGNNKQGHACTEGVYYYIATASLRAVPLKPMEGFLQLIR